jgi:ribonuclease P protein component
MERLSTIKKKREFTELFQSGTVFHDRHMVLYVAPGTGPLFRYGLCVGKKIGNSVQRNRIRRRLREILRQSASFLKRGCRMLIIARSTCKNAPFYLMKEEFHSLCARASVIYDV